MSKMATVTTSTLRSGEQVRVEIKHSVVVQPHLAASEVSPLMRGFGMVSTDPRLKPTQTLSQKFLASTEPGLVVTGSRILSASGNPLTVKWSLMASVKSASYQLVYDPKMTESMLEAYEASGAAMKLRQALEAAPRDGVGAGIMKFYLGKKSQRDEILGVYDMANPHKWGEVSDAYIEKPTMASAGLFGDKTPVLVLRVESVIAPGYTDALKSAGVKEWNSPVVPGKLIEVKLAANELEPVRDLIRTKCVQREEGWFERTFIHGAGKRIEHI